MDRVSDEEPAGTADPARLDPGGILAMALGRTPGADELLLWASMPTDRREKTLARISILRRWVEEPGEMTAAEAARDADLAVSRWYEVAAAWKASPVLASVGTFAKRPGRSGQRLDGEVVNRIHSILPGLIASDKHATVAAIVSQLQADSRLQGRALPHFNTLRTMVQRERRRQLAERQVGKRPGFDAAACDLLRVDGTPHVVFAVVDRTSHLILGFAVGDLAESRAAYARAAADALARMSAANAPALPWADATDRIDVVAGSDANAWARARAEYDANPVGPIFGLLGEGRRFGRYLRLAAGDAIGNLRIYPARTKAGKQAGAGHRYSDEDALAAIEVEVARHNSGVLTAIEVTGASRPAPVTVRMLEFMARS
jgi:hypothetical protein